MLIPRETLLNKSLYDNIEQEIDTIKKYFSSSSMTSLQQTVKINQKWPLLNLVKKVLKAYNYNMIQFKKACGYDKNKKKIFKRYFKIEKIKSIPEINCVKEIK